MTRLYIATQKGDILRSLHERCLDVTGRARGVLARYGVQVVGPDQPCDVEVTVTFDRHCERAPFGWTELVGTRAEITVAAERLAWPWVGDRLLLLVLVHEIGHALGVPRSGPVSDGQSAPHCTDPACVMTTPGVSGWRSVLAWVAARGRARFCASCAAVLRERRS